MSAAAPPVFDLLADVAADYGYEGDAVAIGSTDELVTVILLPNSPESVGCHFTPDVFGEVEDARAFVDRTVQQMTLEVSAKLATLSPEDEALDRLQELIPYLQHRPGCPTIATGDDQGDESACLCGLSADLDGLRDDHRIDVARCRGCGQHAVTPDGTEDWAFRTPKVGDPEPFCHSCAVALGA